MFTAVQSVRFDTQKTAYLQHYSDGPFLSVKCCEFTPTYKHQIHALKKDANGWHSVRTTAYCVVDEINVAEYIRNNIDFATFEARSNGTYPVNNLFDLAWEHKKVGVYLLSPPLGKKVDILASSNEDPSGFHRK